MFTLSLLACLILVDIVLFTCDRYGWSFVVFLGCFVFAHFFVFDLLSIYNQYGLKQMLVYSLYYLLFGMLVSTVKWVIYHLKFASKLQAAKLTFQNEYKTDQYDQLSKDERMYQFAKYLENNKRFLSLYTELEDFRATPAVEAFEPERFINQITPRAANHIGDITCWTLMWPITIVSTLFQEFLVKLADKLAKLFDFVFTKMSQMLIRRVVKDI